MEELFPGHKMYWRGKEYNVLMPPLPILDLTHGEFDTEAAFQVQLYTTINVKNGFPFMNLSIRWNGNPSYRFIIVHDVCNQSICPANQSYCFSDSIHETFRKFAELHSLTLHEIAYLHDGLELFLHLFDTQKLMNE